MKSIKFYFGLKSVDIQRILQEYRKKIVSRNLFVKKLKIKTRKSNSEYTRLIDQFMKDIKGRLLKVKEIRN